MKNSCLNCMYYSQESDYEDHYLHAGWDECLSRPRVSNLKQFPFKKTKCPLFVDKRDNEET